MIGPARRRGPERRRRARRRHHGVQRPAGAESRRARQDGHRHQAGHVGAREGAAEQAGADADTSPWISSISTPSSRPSALRGTTATRCLRPTGRRVRSDARQRHAADRAAPAAAVRADGRPRHRGRPGRSGGRPAARGRHHPVDQPQTGGERHRGGARAAGGRLGPHRADPDLARRQPGVRDDQEGIATDLLTRIRERGPLTVAAFMDLALYDPEAGYYARAAQRSGRAGDFFTSVDVGPVFGELLEIQLAEMAASSVPARCPPALPPACLRPRRGRSRQRTPGGGHPRRGAAPRSGVLRPHPPPSGGRQPCRTRGAGDVLGAGARAPRLLVRGSP